MDKIPPVACGPWAPCLPISNLIWTFPPVSATRSLSLLLCQRYHCILSAWASISPPLLPQHNHLCSCTFIRGWRTRCTITPAMLALPARWGGGRKRQDHLCKERQKVRLITKTQEHGGLQHELHPSGHFARRVHLSFTSPLLLIMTLTFCVNSLP